MKFYALSVFQIFFQFFNEKHRLVGGFKEYLARRALKLYFFYNFMVFV